MSNRSFNSPVVLLLAAPLAFFAVFFVAPIAVVALASITGKNHAFTFGYYAKILTDQYHWEIILTTFRIGATITVACILIGYPMAWYLVRVVRFDAWRRVCVILLIVPLFTSNIVRSFGWMVLLGRNGLVNHALVAMGLADRPLRFLGTETGIVIGLTYILLPFIVLAVGNVLAQFDSALEHASLDLGAAPAATFWHITLPLTLPGLVSGAIMVFALAVSAYVTPALLSGGKVTVLSILIFQQYSAVFDFHYGGALSMVLLILTLILVAAAGRVQGRHLNGAV